MKKLIIVSAAAFLLVLIAALLVTGCFGALNSGLHSPSPTETVTPSPTATPTPTPTWGQPTLIVPDDYPTISSAIANATDGYLIIVKDGTYNETTLCINKTLTIQSEHRGGATIILHPPLRHPTNWVQALGPKYEHAIKITCDNVSLSGFSIKCADCEGDGILLCECDGFQISNNSLPDTCLFFGGNNNRVEGNSILNISFNGNNNTIVNNRLSSLTVVGGKNNTFESNAISGEITRYDLQ
jgi:hypothetical protein